MRRAEWRRRADDPKTLLGWWWRGVFQRGNLHWVFLFPVVVATIILGMTGHWVPLAASLFACAVAFATPLKEYDRLKPMLPKPAPEGQFRASVEYRRDGIVTGRDEMALTVVDGWLVGEGMRSYFALRSADVGAPQGWREELDRQERLALTDGSEIRLRGDIANVVAPRTVIERWRQSEPPVGEPTFPPARVHPQEMARWFVWANLGFCLIFVPSLVATYLHAQGRYAEIRIALSCMAFALAWFAASRFFRLGETTVAAEREKALAGQAPPLQGPTEETPRHPDAAGV